MQTKSQKIRKWQDAHIKEPSCTNKNYAVIQKLEADLLQYKKYWFRCSIFDETQIILYILIIILLHVFASSWLDKWNSLFTVTKICLEDKLQLMYRPLCYPSSPSPLKGSHFPPLSLSHACKNPIKPLNYYIWREIDRLRFPLKWIHLLTSKLSLSTFQT